MAENKEAVEREITLEDVFNEIMETQNLIASSDPVAGVQRSVRSLANQVQRINVAIEERFKEIDEQIEKMKKSQKGAEEAEF